MLNIRFGFFLIVMFILTSAIAEAGNFYVNPSSSSPTEDGSAANPWKSLSAVNANMKSLHPGDSVLLKTGELYYDRLKITCSGTDAQPIVFSYYGSNPAKPALILPKSKKEE